ncbi:MAG: tRNA lysidine(34) synthetase, partial [Chryseobacterium sp.]
LNFFGLLCKEFGYEAVMLAHHADDHAETVLKRIFEGAPIAHLCGIKQESEILSLSVWRPLLNITKKQILEWLEKKDLKGFDDSTNYDTKFLRARMRLELLPHLRTLFGKEIAQSLCYLGKESSELINYLDEQVKPYLSLSLKGPFGAVLDMSQKRPRASFELKHLIRVFCKGEEVSLSRESLEEAVKQVAEGVANKRLDNKFVFIDRYKLFILKQSNFSLPLDYIELPEDGDIVFGAWKITVEKINSDKNIKKIDLSDSIEVLAKSKTGWQSVFIGSCTVYLPDGHFKIAKPSSDMRYNERVLLSHYWSQHKVPNFLRNFVPVIQAEDCIQHEFLSGCYKKDFIPIKRISITFC